MPNPLRAALFQLIDDLLILRLSFYSCQLPERNCVTQFTLGLSQGGSDKDYVMLIENEQSRVTLEHLPLPSALLSCITILRIYSCTLCSLTACHRSHLCRYLVYPSTLIVLWDCRTRIPTYPCAEGHTYAAEDSGLEVISESVALYLT
jgi:hypothetical protein